MEKLKQELTDSKMYEVQKSVNELITFISHDNKFSILFIKEQVIHTRQMMEHIEIVIHDKSMPEGYVAAKIYIEISRVRLENILQNLKEMGDD